MTWITWRVIQGSRAEMFVRTLGLQRGAQEMGQGRLVRRVVGVPVVVVVEVQVVVVQRVVVEEEDVEEDVEAVVEVVVVAVVVDLEAVAEEEGEGEGLVEVVGIRLCLHLACESVND